MSIWLKKKQLTVSTAHPEKQSKHPLVRFNSIHHVTEMDPLNPKGSKNIKPDSPIKWSEKSSLCLH